MMPGVHVPHDGPPATDIYVADEAHTFTAEQLAAVARHAAGSVTMWTNAYGPGDWDDPMGPIPPTGRAS